MCTNLMLALPNVTEVAAAPPAVGIQPLVEKLYVSARSFEMPGVIEQSLYVVGAGQTFPLTTSLFPVQGPLTWTASQDFVGIAPSGQVTKAGVYSPEIVWDTMPAFNDGVNLAGLSVGALWLAPGTQYPASGSSPYPEVSFLDFPAWVLGTCTTAADVRTALQGTQGGNPAFTVVGPPPPTASTPSPYYIPLHYVITDASGATLIVEFTGGQTNIYDSDNAVLANAPTYDWQTINATFYQHLTPLGGATSATGAGAPLGSNFQGLPGDPSSPSRFLKAWCETKGYAMLPDDGDGWLPAPCGGQVEGNKPAGFAYAQQTGVTAALQMVQMCMGTPYGMLVERKDPKLPLPLTYSDFTQWTTVRDHTNKAYYFQSAFSGLLTKVDLTAIDFANAPAYPDNLTLPVLPQPGIDWCYDATSKLTSAEVSSSA